VSEVEEEEAREDEAVTTAACIAALRASASRIVTYTVGMEGEVGREEGVVPSIVGSGPMVM